MLKKAIALPRRAASLLATVLIVVAGCSGGGGGGGGGDSATVPPNPPPTSTDGPAWWAFGRDAQHSAQGAIATQPLNRIIWSTPVDRAVQYSGTALLIHYGSPVIMPKNTVILPVKTGAQDGFRFEARSGTTGTLIWTVESDYRLPAHNWIPSYNVTLTRSGSRVYAPGSGGKVLYRDNPDSATGSSQSLVFYGTDLYNSAKQTFDDGVMINTPITVDADGNLFFGFLVTGTNPAGLASGIARIGADGRGTWVGVSTALGLAGNGRVNTNAAPALSDDLKTLYVGVNLTGTGSTTRNGYLLALDSTTLAVKGQAMLLDPVSGLRARITDDASSSPTVGPDGDVFFGVLESTSRAHNARGWLLHFDATLSQSKIPGSFGWDDTPSIVPATAVPAYNGTSSYLLLTKYNNYGGAGTGDGKNRMAILDPNQSQADSFSTAQVMREVLTVLGPTPDNEFPGGVKEWCVNTGAVDPLTRSALVNSEDGTLYRWDFTTNQLSQKIVLNNGYAESYTPTAIGPDGTVYVINNAVLFAVGR